MEKCQKWPIMDFPSLEAEMRHFINCDFRLVSWKWVSYIHDLLQSNEHWACLHWMNIEHWPTRPERCMLIRAVKSCQSCKRCIHPRVTEGKSALHKGVQKFVTITWLFKKMALELWFKCLKCLSILYNLALVMLQVYVCCMHGQFPMLYFYTFGMRRLI